MVDVFNSNLDRQRAVVVELKSQPKNLTLKEWYEHLTDIGLVIGQDYCWAWKDNNMAIEIFDPKVAIMTKLKLHD
jgi:hypothetical protein